MAKLEPVVRLSGDRLAIAYPGERGVKVVRIADGNPQELFSLTLAQLQQMADAVWLPEGISFDEGLAIILTWISVKGA